jgi:predicted PhzF superfamily epimerase YddE/YHI9
VTGSAHCTLVPYWSQRLGLKTMRARQLSKRRGELYLEDRGQRVEIAGKASLYATGTIYL